MRSKEDGGCRKLKRKIKVGPFRVHFDCQEKKKNVKGKIGEPERRNKKIGKWEETNGVDG